MASENEILDELRAMESPLAEAPRTMPFAVPDAYFEGLDGRLVAGVGAAEGNDPVLDLPAEAPFLVPEDYFKDAAPRIVSAASLPEANNPYALPDGYFEGLPSRVMDAVREPVVAVEKKPKARIIAFPQWRIARIAAAALMVLCMSYGAKVYFTPDSKASRRLSRVDKEAIGEYVTQSIDPLAEPAPATNVPAAVGVKDLSPEEITRYLDETGWEDATTAN